MKYAPFGKSLLACLAISASGSALAANSAVEELLKALYQNGTIDKTTYELVQQAAQAEAKQNREEIREISVAESQKVAGEVIAKAKSSKPSVTLGGRIQLDAGSVHEDNIDHNSGTEIRRARLFAKGDLHEDWGYKLQYDFTSTGSSGIQDAYLDYKPLKIRIGHAKEPFSLQNMTSSKYVTFIERGLPHVFAEGRNIGIQTSRNGDNWMIAGGIFGDGRDGGSGGENNEGWGAAARATIAPINTDVETLHLGTSLSYRNVGGDHTLRFRERPEAHITDKRIVDTRVQLTPTTHRDIDANNIIRGVLEAAYINGPFHVQGEYYHTEIERQLSGMKELNFGGYYVETGLFLTDDSVNYKASKGSYSRVTPTGGNGAWQIAARFSSLDLTDEDISGGEAESLTLGLNWFAAPNIRFSANYINILDVDGGPTDGDEPDAFTLRTQVEF